MSMRLQRYLALCGIASRRASETLIREGRVTVNGAIAALGSSVDPDHDEVRVNGKPIRRERPVYILLHKPKGTITTVDDPQGRRTVLDCLQGVRARVYPVGRLDLDVSGVLLLTNDGELAQRLTHPRYGVTKVYIATVRGHVSDEALRRLDHPQIVKYFDSGSDRSTVMLSSTPAKRTSMFKLGTGVLVKAQRSWFLNIRSIKRT